MVALGSCGRVGFDPRAISDGLGAPDVAGDACAMPANLTTTGLVGWWPFDDGSGLTARDVVAGNDGVLVAGVTWTAGHLGGAIALDGTSGHVDIAGSAAYATHDAAFSFSAWVSLTDWMNVDPDIMQMMTDDASTSPFHVLWSDDPSYDGMSTGDGDASWIPTKTQVEPSTGTWHHVAMVYDGGGATTPGSFTFYLDGAVQALVAAGGYGTQANASRIGAAEVSSNNWHGLIDDVRIYNRALAATEVSQLVALTCD